MDTDVLRFFQQIADGVTVTEVAELYQVSQPGVSRSLRRLEEEVGTPLLERSGRILRPTHAGRVLKRHVDASLHALDDGLAAVEELLDPETGTVGIGFQPSLGTWLVPRVILPAGAPSGPVPARALPRRPERLAGLRRTSRS
jgi:LysR family transcriptional activator of glutamate synthase operon